MPDDAARWRQPQYVLIVGAHSSGKSTLARMVARALGGVTVEMGDVVRGEAHLLHETNLVKLADDILSADPLFIARRTVAVMGRHRGSVVVVGPRTRDEVNFLTTFVPNILTVGLQADETLRHRQWKRRRLRFTDTWLERESHEGAWGTGNLVGLCELIIDARASPRRKLALVLDHLREEHGGG